MPQAANPEILQHLSASTVGVLGVRRALMVVDDRDAMIDIAAARLYSHRAVRLYLVPCYGIWALCSRPTAGLDYIQVERDGYGGAVARLYRA